MTNYFYTDTDGQKLGPFDERHLKAFAASKLIAPETPMETDAGEKGVCGDIPELFSASQHSHSPKDETSSEVPLASQASFCTYCGRHVSERASVCMACGTNPIGHKKFCRQCGVALNPEQLVCVKCGTKVPEGSGVFDFLFNADKIKAFCSVDKIKDGVDKARTFAADRIKILQTLFRAFWVCTGGGLLSNLIGAAMLQDMGSGGPPAGITALLLITGFLGVLAGLIVGCVLFYHLWALISKRVPKPTTPPNQIHVIMRRIPFGIGLIYMLLVEAWKLPKNLNKILQKRGIPFQANEWLAMGFFIALVIVAVTWTHINLPTFGAFSFMAVCCIGIFHLKALTDGTIILLKQEEQTENGQTAAQTTVRKPEPTSATSVQVEKYRVFQSNKLLGMFEDGVIREKLDRREFRTSDFVMIPLETFLREISASDKPFPYYRDGKRLDQYTLQQVRDLHESGQTQPIDHILLPMPVFIERNPA